MNWIHHHTLNSLLLFDQYRLFRVRLRVEKQLISFRSVTSVPRAGRLAQYWGVLLKDKTHGFPGLRHLQMNRTEQYRFKFFCGVMQAVFILLRCAYILLTYAEVKGEPGGPDNLFT
jgi:hypothetical protein